MLTIITSLYRSEKYLPKFLKKAQAESLKLSAINIDHEFILVANDPTQTEMTLINTYTIKNPHIKVQVRPLETIYSSWNAGVAVAQYNIITFWNVDDIRFTKGFMDGIKTLTDGAEVTYFPFIYKRYVRIFNIPFLVKIKIFNPIEFNAERFQKEMHGGPFFMFSKEAYRKAGAFDPSFSIAGDFDWIARAARSGVVIKKCGTIAGIFTNDGRTLSGSKTKNHQEENLRVYNSK